MNLKEQFWTKSASRSPHSLAASRLVWTRREKIICPKAWMSRYWQTFLFRLNCSYELEDFSFLPTSLVCLSSLLIPSNSLVSTHTLSCSSSISEIKTEWRSSPLCTNFYLTEKASNALTICAIMQWSWRGLKNFVCFLGSTSLTLFWMYSANETVFSGSLS